MEFKWKCLHRHHHKNRGLFFSSVTWLGLASSTQKAQTQKDTLTKRHSKNMANGLESKMQKKRD